MAGVGLILGSGAAGLDVPGVLAVSRHGEREYVLPHLIDHGANLRRLAGAGCDRVLGIASVGSLRADLPPGTLVCPDDFIALDAGPVTTLSGREAHRVPRFDAEWRARVIEVMRTQAEVRDGGVYWQVSGPRLETRAEVRFAAAHADVIGMTVGSECVVAGELGVAYAALCVVDNYANGIAETELTLEEVETGQREHRAALERALAAAVPQLARA